MWYKSNCIPAYTSRNATTGLQVLSVSTNAQDYIALPAPIHYYNESAVFQVQPTFGAVSGGTIVTVTGPPDFIPSPEARCRFDAMTVPATVTASAVKCLTAPVVSGRTVSFAVALDGQHFVCTPDATNGHCSFFFFEKVRVDSLFPSIGSTLGGMSISVFGLAFLPFNTARCRFGTASTRLFVSTGKSGVCDTPAAAAAGLVDFAVTINGVDEEPLATGFKYYMLPQLSGLAPNGAALDGGASITVSGMHFAAYANHLVLCRFTLMALRDGVLTRQHAANQSVSVIASSVMGTSVVCAAPPRNTNGSHALQVSIVGEQTVAGLVGVGEEWSPGLEFVYYLLPSMSSMRPVTGGVNGGTAVLAILSGAVTLNNFARCIFEPEGRKSVHIQGKVVNQNALGCAAPPLSLVNDRHPTVRIALNGQDLTATKSHVFSYVEEPVSSAVAPTRTTTAGGTILRVTGSNFAASFWASCVFRGPSMAVAPATIVSSVEARCKTPPLARPGTYEVTVSPSNTFEGTPVSLLVVAGAHVATLLPSHGLLQGGTSVTFVGTNFVIHETPICLFGLRMVQGRHVNEQNLVCQSPSSPVDRLFQVQVTLSLDGGVTYFENSTRSYEYYPLLSVQDFYPQLGVIQGGTSVTISATGVRNVTGLTCRFGVKKVGATILRNSAAGVALLQCVSPPHAEGLVDFALALNGQDGEFALASAKYNFHRPLVPIGIWPTAGPIMGGTLVTLAADQGSRTIFPLDADFVQRPTLLPPDPMPPSQWVVCKVGAETVSGRQLADGIECRVPPCTGVNASGMVRRIQVSVNGQEFVSSDLYRFLCAEMPVVDAVEPSIGPAEVGSRVTLSGRNFTGTTRSRCLVGNISGQATVINSTMAYCDVRPITPMNISRQSRDFVKAPASGAGAGSLGINRVTLAVDGQHYSAKGGANFSYYPSPAVHKIDPPSATTMQGPVTVTLTGRGFTPYSNAFARAQCRFGDVVVKAYVNTSETIECTAPAQPSGVAVLVELSFNQRDFEGHNSVFFLRRAPAPQVERVSFLSSLNVLEIRWRNATDRATFRSSAGAEHCGVTSRQPCGVVYRNSLVGPFKCDMVLAASDAMLGYGASCRWHDNFTLAVSLGASPTLVPGGALPLRPRAVMQGSQLSYPSSAQLPSVVLPNAVDIPTPMPVVIVSTVVAACKDMVLDATMSYNHGGRPLNFSWTLVSPTSVEPRGINVSRLLEAQASSGTASKISFPSALVAPGDYTIRLVVSSWFARTASTAVTVTKSTASNIPSVSILAPSTLTTRPGKPLELTALVSPSTCSTSSAAAAISLQWSVHEQLAGATGADVLASSPSISRAAPVLRLPPFTLSANKAYLVQVTASQNGVEARASVSITVASGAVVAWISGGDRTVPHNHNLWLDASASLDPDVSSSATTPLRFSWQCQVVNVAQRSAAPCASVDANMTIADPSNAVTVVPLGSAHVGQRMCSAAATSHLCGGAWEFVFSVDVSRADGSGLSTASMRVRIARANATASVNISSAPCAASAGRCKVNVHEPLTLQGHVLQSDNAAGASASSGGAWVTNWSTWQGDVDISRRNLTLTATGSLTLVLRPNVLTQGAVYTFRLSARRADAPALGSDASADAATVFHAQIVVKCNAAPEGGYMRIDRTRGAALTSNFTLMAVDWTDDPEDMPLKYSFFAVINATSTASNVSNSSLEPGSQAVTVISSSLLPQHVVSLPMGAAPLHTVDLMLLVEDSLGVGAQHAGCVTPSSLISTQRLPCRVEVTPPASGADALLNVLEGEGTTLLARASVSERSDVVFGVVGAMLSILNSPSVNGAGGSRRQGSAGSSKARARALRDAILTSVAGFLQPSRVPLLSSRALADAATTLKGIAHVPSQVSPTAQSTLTTLAVAVVASPDTGRSSTVSKDVGATLSSLREALEHARLEAGDMSSVAALEQQDRLEAGILSLTRGAISSHSPGQDAEVLHMDTFLTYGRVFPVRRAAAAGGIATLKTRQTLLLGGSAVYQEWKSGVSVLVPDVQMPGCLFMHACMHTYIHMHVCVWVCVRVGFVLCVYRVVIWPVCKWCALCPLGERLTITLSSPYMCMLVRMFNPIR